MYIIIVTIVIIPSWFFETVQESSHFFDESFMQQGKASVATMFRDRLIHNLVHYGRVYGGLYYNTYLYIYIIIIMCTYIYIYLGVSRHGGTPNRWSISWTIGSSNGWLGVTPFSHITGHHLAGTQRHPNWFDSEQFIQLIQ